MGSISLSLRPTENGQADSHSIADLVTRINSEHGHFRDITESSLLEEIALEEAKKDTIDDNEAAVEEKKDGELRREEIYAARGEMLKLIGQAQNEALTALDFISLLISKDAPAQANQSMSPLLKRLVQPGTLGYDKTPASKPTAIDREDNYKVVFGWNIQTLDAVADKLVSSANRLEKEMQKEAQYWQQALTLREKGWAVCRMPREKHTLGVRFGFSEASPLFYSKGLAALRGYERGRLYLDQGPAYQEKCLQIQIFEKGNLVEESKLRPTILSSSEPPLEELVEQARDSLFDEELFHELGREARDLLAYGVRVQGQAVHFPLLPPFPKHFSSPKPEPQPEAVVRLIHKCTDTLATLPTQSSARADSILLAMRILLTDNYRRKAKYRARPAPPISNQRHRIPSYSILEPIMYRAQHMNVVEQLKTYCERLNKIVRHAGISCTMTVQNKVPSFTTTASRTTTAMESITHSLCNPLLSEICLTYGEAEAAKVSVQVLTRSSSTDGTRGTQFLVKTFPLATLDKADSTNIEESSNVEPVGRQESRVSEVQSSIHSFVNDFLPIWMLKSGAVEWGWMRVDDYARPGNVCLANPRKRVDGSDPDESKAKYLLATPQLSADDSVIYLVGNFKRVIARWDGNPENDHKNNGSGALLEKIKLLSP